jgi:ligand-binding SRPBCC domain-containing protein
MRTFRQSFIVKSPIETVWHFYTDVRHLETITPKEIELKIKILFKDRRYGHAEKYL